MSKLVSVFVCGVQKGGTSSLDAHFCQHPELSPARKKEVHFFDRDNRDWKNPDYSELEEFYKADDAERLRFDITPIYSFWPSAIKRIHAYNPSAKLVLLFRDPFDRAWSHWCMIHTRDRETMSFAEAIRGGRTRLRGKDNVNAEMRNFTYLERGMYGEQVRRILKYFPRDQVLFLRTEDFAADYRGTLNKVSNFLGVSPFPDNGQIRKHKKSKFLGSQKPTEEDRLFVARLLRDDILEFSKLAGLPVSDWPTMRILAENDEKGMQVATNDKAAEPPSNLRVKAFDH